MNLEGQRIGRYYISRLLGRGGMGEVFLAADPRIEQEVAIKVVRTEDTPYPNSESSKEGANSFLREARAIARLDHPNILPMYDYGEEHLGEEHITYIVMPYRKEGSLAAWIQQHATKELLSLQDTADFLRQAANALQHAHDRQIIHQDVKPSNFLLRSRKEDPRYPDLLLADFGIARLYSATSSASATIRGTPAYMAPEQWRSRPVFASDQYALAVMAYQLLTGRLPFHGGFEQIMFQHFYEQPSLPSILNPRLSPDINAVLLQALAKNAEDRFPSITEFSQAFQEASRKANLPTNPIAPPPPKSSDNDLRFTLAVSEEEAINGTTRVVTLPGGQHITLPVQPGAFDGQVIRLGSLADPTGPNKLAGDLVVTLSVIRSGKPASGTTNDDQADRTVLTRHTPQIIAIPPTLHATPTALPGPITPTSIPKQRQGLSRGKSVLLLVLALLFIAGSIGGFVYFTTANQIATAHFNATATANRSTAVAANATASTFLYPPYSGMLVLNDPLKDNSRGYNWINGRPADPGTGCVFEGGSYHVIESINQQNFYCIAGAKNATFSNFAFQVQMAFIKGDLSSFGGIIFRHANHSHYFFQIGRNGSYTLLLISDAKFSTLQTGSSSAIHTDLNVPNTLAVVARGGIFDLYVNQQHVIHVSDSSYSQGQIGLFAEDLADSTAAPNVTEVAFSDAKVWAL